MGNLHAVWKPLRSISVVTRENRDRVDSGKYFVKYFDGSYRLLDFSSMAQTRVMMTELMLGCMI